MYDLELIFNLDLLLRETDFINFYAPLDCGLGLNLADSIGGRRNETRFVIRYAKAMVVLEFPIFCGLGHL